MMPSQHTPAAASSTDAGVPREVVHVGRGLPPATMAVATIMLMAPGILTPFIIRSVVTVPEELGAASFLPSLVWLVIGGAMLWSGAVKPWRRQRLVTWGAFTGGRVTTQTRKERGAARPLFIHDVAWRAAHDTADRVLREQSERALAQGTAVHIAYWPEDPGSALVVELGDFQVRDPSAPARFAVGPVRMFVMLACVVVLFAELVSEEVAGFRALLPEAGQPYGTLGTLLLILVGGTALRTVLGLRSGAIEQSRGLWRLVLVACVGFAAFGSMLFLNRRLGVDARTAEFTVLADFELHLPGRAPIHVVELGPPERFQRFRLVPGGDVPLRVGSTLRVPWFEGRLGIPCIEDRSDNVLARRPYRPEVDDIPLNKSRTTGDAMTEGGVEAVGEFAAESQARARLKVLGVPVRNP